MSEANAPDKRFRDQTPAVAGDRNWVQFYTSFKGRATRKDFNIYYAVPALMVTILAAVLDYILAGGDIMLAVQQTTFSDVFNLLLIWPTCAVAARRLHDMNFSGWWQLAPIVLFILMMPASYIPLLASASLIMIAAALVFGFIFLIILSIKRGTVGPNKFGPDPLEGVVA